MTTPYSSEAFLHQILAKAHAADATDVHLKVGQPPGARVRGDMVYFRAEPLEPKDTEAVARLMVTRRTGNLPSLSGLQELELPYEVPQLGRFRVSLYLQRGSLAIVMRVIPATCPTFEQLKLPKSAQALADLPHGLVVVAGRAGHGKTWTLASMVAHISTAHSKHIVTIEDPIEFVHLDGRSGVSQREIRSDTSSFVAGIHAAMRQDANVILVGNIGDPAVLDAALEAAEAGHLVLTSFATANVERTIGRLLALGPNTQEARNRLSSCLQGVVAQRLLPRAGANEQILATEVLTATSAVRAAIKQPEQNPPLREMMERDTSPDGMHSFALDIARLVKAGLIDAEVARQLMV